MTEGAAERMVRMAESLALEKKARETVILDIGKVSLIADYFLITEGANKIQVKAIADHLLEKLEEAGFTLLHKEGYDDGNWILLDYGSVVIHLFLPEARSFYKLERLWGHAPRLAAVEG